MDYKDTLNLPVTDFPMRAGLPQSGCPTAWQATARGLRTFYHHYKIYGEALALDRQIHAKLNTVESATMLAETLLATDAAAEAENLLTGIDAKTATPNTLAVLGVALARQQKLERAGAVAELDIDLLAGRQG